MEKELEQFQQEAQRLKSGRKGGALPFPEAMRAFAVRYAEQTVKGGGTVVAVAAKLGVSAPTTSGARAARRAVRRGRSAPRPARCWCQCEWVSGHSSRDASRCWNSSVSCMPLLAHRLRDMVMGRKNHYGSKSQRGTGRHREPGHRLSPFRKRAR
jgi:hypothetical protein